MGACFETPGVIVVGFDFNAANGEVEGVEFNGLVIIDITLDGRTCTE